MFKFFKKSTGTKDEVLVLAFRARYEAFQQLLHENNAVLELMADLEEKSSGGFLFDMNYIDRTVSQATTKVSSIINSLNILSGNKYRALDSSFENIRQSIERMVRQRKEIPPADYVIPLKNVTADMPLIAGGKMSNIGEMKNRLDLPVPEGFVITSSAFKRFIEYHALADRLKGLLTGLDLKDTSSIESASREFQKLIMDSGLPPDLDTAIRAAAERLQSGRDMTVSVRSSALAEDGHFSFAGQYATYLHVSPEDIPDRYLAVLSSLFTARAYSKFSPKDSVF